MNTITPSVCVARQISDFVVKSVSLYAEFGCRGGRGYYYPPEFPYNPQENNVMPDEGVYLARLARQYYKKTGSRKLTYKFFQKCFSDEIYLKNKELNSEYWSFFSKETLQKASDITWKHFIEKNRDYK